MDKNKNENPTVALAGTICAFAVGIAALIVIFAKNYAWTIIFTTLTLCFFGIALAKKDCTCGPNCECHTKPKEKKK